MWRDASLSWKDFLPEDEDVNKFVTEKVGNQFSGNSSRLINASVKLYICVCVGSGVHSG